jgi:hypothetical protein
MNSSEIYNIVFLDSAVLIMLFVMADLSKRLGEALKTPPYYKLFYVGVCMIVTAVLINTIFVNSILVVSHAISTITPMALRCCTGILAVFACLQYWKWLFSEIFK